MNASTMSADTDDNATVVFWFWRNLNYQKRMLLSFSLLALGLLLQWYFVNIVVGVLPLLAGNALLLVRGYDNRVEFKGFDPSQQWQKVERSRLAELRHLDRKIESWDRSYIDITNGRGIFTFILMLLFLWFCVAFIDSHRALEYFLVIPVDMAILFLPHWFTGTRRILRLPALLIKAETLETVLDKIRPEEQGDQVDVLMLLKGKQSVLPEDIKIRIEAENAAEEFLGLYGQVVINNVQGKSYPYFYAVMVARPGLGLAAQAKQFRPPKGVVAEYKEKDGVDILVIRQYTTKKSGYHTSAKKTETLLRLGLEQMHKLL